MKLGFWEILVVVIVALLVIGPDKLPFYAKKLGQALKEFRKVSEDMTKEVRESVIEPLEEIQKPLKEAMEPLEDLTKDIKENITGVEKDLKGIGKPKEEIQNEDWCSAASDRSYHCHYYFWADTDSEAYQNVGKERKRL